MSLIDVKQIQAEAKKELAEEQTKRAKEKLKELYQRREKAQLCLKNIDREIESYLNEVAELAVYESAGVDVTSGE
jgi:hypothetical protein